MWTCIPAFHSIQSARTERWYSEYTWLKAGRISFRPPQKVKTYNCSYMSRARPWRHMGERRKSSIHFFLSRQIFTFLPTHPDKPSLLLNTVDEDCSFTRSRATGYKTAHLRVRTTQITTPWICWQKCAGLASFSVCKGLKKQCWIRTWRRVTVCLI